MTTTTFRAAIVGASSVLGKELAEQLSQAGGSLWELALLDASDAAGQMTAAGEEALIIQPLTPEAFTGMDVVFFAADAAATREHWRVAVAAGSGVVDLTGTLTEEPGIDVRAPLLAAIGLAERRLDLATEAVVAAHPVTLMLSIVSTRLRSQWGDRVRMFATILLPASEHGKAGMDELHAQTVALLSFQPVPRDFFDAQIAFNVNAGFGADAKDSLETISSKIDRELQGLLGVESAAFCVFQCVQVPVFHGFSASIFLEFEESVQTAAVANALESPSVLTVLTDEPSLPSSATASEQEAMQGTLRMSGRSAGRGAWLWLAGDNVQLFARNAIACAGELLAMRPAGRVQ